MLGETGGATSPPRIAEYCNSWLIRKGDWNHLPVECDGQTIHHNVALGLMQPGTGTQFEVTNARRSRRRTTIPTT